MEVYVHLFLRRKGIDAELLFLGLHRLCEPVSCFPACIPCAGPGTQAQPLTRRVNSLQFFDPLGAHLCKLGKKKKKETSTMGREYSHFS